MTNPGALVAYIGPMCIELRNLASAGELVVIAHLLDMAALEASGVELQSLAQTIRDDDRPKLTNLLARPR